MLDSAVCAQATAEAVKEGADYADIFVERTYTTQIIFEDGKTEKIVTGTDSGAGLRIIDANKSWYGFTTDLTPEGLISLAGKMRSAVARGAKLRSASAASAHTHLGDLTENKTRHGSREPGLTAPAGSIIRPAKPADTIAMAEKTGLVRKANDVIRAADGRIRQARITYGDSIRRIKIVDTDGTDIDDEKHSIVFLAFAVAADGSNVQTGYEPVGGAGGYEFFDRHDPFLAAKASAERAILMLGADPMPAGTMTVVISSEAGGTMTHEAVGHGLEGDFVEQKLSVYAGRLGQQVANPQITVIDDGTIPGNRGTYRFDDEGVRANKNILVENGVLKGYMFDRLSAMRNGAVSTGNGRRENFRHRPIPRMTNTMIAPGKYDPEEILRSVKSGLFVRKMGGGQVNIVNGDFVFDVTEGYIIENGRLGRPVRGASLIGNGPKVLGEIDMVGKDIGFAIGTCGKDGQGAPVSDAQPTLRIPAITVGGVKV